MAIMFDSCLKKQKDITDLFSNCPTKEAKYQKIIELGRQLPALDNSHKTVENLVKGCQSTMYLRSYLMEDKVIFEAQSDALISAGLAALLLQVYSGETSETILKCSPIYLEEMGISASLTPNRANGLFQIHLRMKQDALKLLIAREAEKHNTPFKESL